MEDKYGNVVASLAETNDKKIVMLVLDGLGDCDNGGKGTALQIARTPNMDRLAQESALGLAHPVSPGITPGSGPVRVIPCTGALPGCWEWISGRSQPVPGRSSRIH